jgi:hypothetical protein
MHWWQDRGPRLFDSPQIEMKLKDLGSGVKYLMPTEVMNPQPKMVYLAIPEYINSVQAQSILYEAWQLARVRGKHYTVSAKYQLVKLALRRKKTIIPAYKSMMLSVSVLNSSVSSKINRWRDLEMGIYLNVSPKQKINQRDNLAVRSSKRNSVRNAFRKTLESFNSLIGNVEIGIFPSKDPVEARVRWTMKQQRLLDDAVAAGKWHSEDWAKREMAYMLPDKELLEGQDQLNETFQILDHFSSLDTPFLETKRKKAAKK